MLSSVPSAFASFASSIAQARPRRSRSHDEHVELHAVAGTCGAVLENQFVER